MDISASIRKLTNFFILLFVILSGGLVYWQVVVAAQVTTNRHNSRSCLFENSPLRGTIYDRNGVWLAKSVPNPAVECGSQRVYADPSLAGLIGYYAGPNYPATGFEKQFDDYLSGRITATSLDSTIDKLLHFAQIGVNTGFNAWIDYNRKFYLEGQIPFDLPVATSHVLPPGRSELADNELAADAYGQGFDFVTPFQMSLVDDAVANDGVLMRPILV